MLVVVQNYSVMTPSQFQGNGKSAVPVMSKSCSTNSLEHVVCWWGVIRHSRSVQTIMVCLTFVMKLAYVLNKRRNTVSFLILSRKLRIQWNLVLYTVSW